MKDIILSILQIAIWVVPARFGIAFLIRSSDSYEDSYSRSSWNMWGVSLRKYKMFFRIFGLVLMILAAVLFYFIHIYKPANGMDEYNDFWNKVDETKGQNLIFKTAMLMSAIAIPARMASTRFPGKPLAKLGGKSKESQTELESYERYQDMDKSSAEYQNYIRKCVSLFKSSVDGWGTDEKVLAYIMSLPQDIRADVEAQYNEKYGENKSFLERGKEEVSGELKKEYWGE